MKFRRLAKHKNISSLAEGTQKRIIDDINASGEVLDFITQILEDRQVQLTSELLSKTMYESPACTHKMADISGGIREIYSLIKLLQVTEE